MTESNNVKFVEDSNKWLWKRYDQNGSVIYRSPLFDTERLAREDYEQYGDKAHTNPQADAPVQEESAEVKGGVNVASPTDTAPQDEMAAGNTTPEGEVGAGSASPTESEAGLV
ncbi:MAG: hypothetical protein KBD47_00220 [Candidatus Pacebacteria bacterium]|nr:hypothetical protein [Candidatus Paceibacterota bacterium]